MKQGIIFDMDGTLWDSSENVAVSWNLAVEKCGYQREPITSEDLKRTMGRTMDVIADILFPDAEPELKAQLLEACCETENDYLREHGGVLYPNLRETMEALKEKYHLYIVSNCQAGYIEAFLDYYKFHDLFEDIECFGNNDKQKNENIALVVERNGIDHAVYVGDIQGDYDASCKAGVDFIHAAYGFGTIDADIVRIDSLSDLTDKIKEVFSE